MKFFLFFGAVLPIVCGATDSISIDQVIANTEKAGFVLLDQGYRGSFCFVKGNWPVQEWEKAEFEFTHACLNDLGIGDEYSKAQTILAWTGSTKEGHSFRSPAIYIEKIPTKEKLVSYESVDDFSEIFGEVRSLADIWSDGPTKRAIFGWMGFSLLTDSSIRVVKVKLQIVNRGDAIEIEARKIGEGVFRPTGNPPKLEPPKNQVVEQGSAQ